MVIYVLDETNLSTTTSTSTSGTTQSTQTWVQVSVSTPGPSTGWFSDVTSAFQREGEDARCAKA